MRVVATLSPNRQRELIRHAQTSARLTSDEVWLRYFGIGGTTGPMELDAYLNGALELPADQSDRIALAINEHIDATAGKYRAPYSRPLRASNTGGPVLAALRDLLHKTHLVPPDALAEALDAAAAHLHVTAVMYLADYDQELLVPFLRHHEQRDALNIDSTLAGRAYQLLQTQTTLDEQGQGRLWVPILDGVERMGVAEITVHDQRDLHDAVLRRELWLLTHYLGHLIAVLGHLGDALDTIRRTKRRTIEAELVSTLLPPLTGGSDKVLISGRVEPAHDMGGDVFDYALSPSAAQFTIMDATGHNLRAGLAASACLATYRKARRQGQGLFAQAESVHRTIADHYEQAMYATAVFAELQLDTGILRYLVAGHPAPLLLRRGKVVKELDQGHRPILGLEGSNAALGEEALEPEDIVVLYTDGITEARDTEAQLYGLDRLIDTLERYAAEEKSLPEIARSINKAILHYQGVALQDDATLLLVQWTTQGQAALQPTPLQHP